MNYWRLDPPAQWRAGYEGADRTPLYFDCADCGAADPPIAGILSSDGTFKGVALLGKMEGCNLRPAMFCAVCFERRIAPDTR